MQEKEPKNNDAIIFICVGLFFLWAYCVGEFLKLLGHGLGL
jgi:hypothetical protein